MCEITDEDFLEALANDPALYAAATQPFPPSTLPTPPAPKLEARPAGSLPGDEKLPASVLPAAQRRRHAIVKGIDDALGRWTATLMETFPDEGPAESPADVSPQSVAMPINALDAYRRGGSTGSEYLVKKELKMREKAGETDLFSTKSNTTVKVEKLDPYQAAAVNAAKAGKSFFLTGSAGTGKSFVLKKIIQELRGMKKEVAVTASTGCAAVGINGCTIHSLSGVGIGIDPIERLVTKGHTSKRLRERFLTLDALVIDEISMIDLFLFNKIEALIRAARTPLAALKEQNQNAQRPRKRIRSGNGSSLTKGTPFYNAPFGGLQVIVCGDFFQLPPVGASDFKYHNSSEKYFAFDSATWKKAIKETFLLRVVHRQADRKFVGLLNELRQGIVSDCTKRVLSACHAPSVNNVEAGEDGKRVHFTKLYAYRRQVETENTMQLKKLKARGVRYVARDFINDPELGTLNRRIAQQMLDNCNAPASIEMRTGARVLCLKNLSQKEGIVNGSAGVIIGWALPLTKIFQKRRLQDLDHEVEWTKPLELRPSEIMDLDDPEITEALKDANATQSDELVAHGPHLGCVSPVVRFDNGRVRHMMAETWDFPGTKGQVVASRRQVPLMLGWALSIHRAQGMTLGEVETDVGRAFDFGQVYVALSRATSVHGLRLKSFDASKVRTNEKVVAFYKKLETEVKAKTEGVVRE